MKAAVVLALTYLFRPAGGSISFLVPSQNGVNVARCTDDGGCNVPPGILPSSSVPLPMVGSYFGNTEQFTVVTKEPPGVTILNFDGSGIAQNFTLPMSEVFGSTQYGNSSAILGVTTQGLTIGTFNDLGEFVYLAVSLPNTGVPFSFRIGQTEDEKIYFQYASRNNEITTLFQYLLETKQFRQREFPAHQIGIAFDTNPDGTLDPFALLTDGINTWLARIRWSDGETTLASPVDGGPGNATLTDSLSVENLGGQYQAYLFTRPSPLDGKVTITTVQMSPSSPQIFYELELEPGATGVYSSNRIIEMSTPSIVRGK